MSAGPLLNTDQTVGFSGLTKSVTNLYGDQKFTAVATSGSQTVVSGAGVLISVIGLAGGLLSGTIFTSSQSGATILVVDGVSGVVPSLQSGATRYASNTAGILYQFAFGTQSGAGTGGLPLGPSNAVVNGVFRSGLVATLSGGTAGGHGISLIYSQGV